MFLHTKRKIYEIKFGLKSIILLQQNLKLIEDKNQKFLLYCGLITQQPNITLDEIDEIISECDINSLSLPSLLSDLQIKELYTKAVGEIGIDANSFYSMTPEEIELAYEGYLRRQETQANLFKLALLDNSDNLIRLTEDKEYSIGSYEERKDTFKKLSIERD